MRNIMNKVYVTTCAGGWQSPAHLLAVAKQLPAIIVDTRLIPLHDDERWTMRGLTALVGSQYLPVRDLAYTDNQRLLMQERGINQLGEIIQRTKVIVITDNLDFTIAVLDLAHIKHTTLSGDLFDLSPDWTPDNFKQSNLF
jgi:hypothetical protein